MSDSVSKYFSNLAAPDPDAADFADLQERIVNVLHVPMDDILNFGTSMIDDMADTIVNDLLSLDEDQEEIFREIFSDTMQQVNKRFQGIINNRIASGSLKPTINNPGWDRVVHMLDRSLKAVAERITYAALTLEYAPMSEKEFEPLDFVEERMEWGEAELQEDLFQLMAPKFTIKDEDVLPFIRYRGVSEDILEDVHECVRGLNLYSHGNVNKIIGVARISLGKIQTLFKEEYDALSGGGDSIPQDQINHWGKCIRNSINVVVTNVSLAMMAAKDERIDPSNLTYWDEPSLDR